MAEGRNHSNRDALGVFLHNARTRAKLTQRQVGEHLEVDPSQVSRWESGDNVPREERAGSIAELYEIDEADLLHRILAAGDEEKAELRRELTKVHRDNEGLAATAQELIDELRFFTKELRDMFGDLGRRSP